MRPHVATPEVYDGGNTLGAISVNWGAQKPETELRGLSSMAHQPSRSIRCDFPLDEGALGRCSFAVRIVARIE